LEKRRLGEEETWRRGDLEKRRLGEEETWRGGDLERRRLGEEETWRRGDLETCSGEALWSAAGSDSATPLCRSEQLSLNPKQAEEPERYALIPS
jgi:hypothetical protein